MHHLTSYITRSRRGIALPSAMFVLVGVSLLAAGMFSITDLGAKAGRNQEDALRAMQLAEAAVSHSVGVVRRELRRNKMSRLLRGNDSMPNTADDGLLWNYAAVPAGEWIPAGGRGVGNGTYFVRFLDDPADPSANQFDDNNSRIIARCRGVTANGAAAEIDAVIGATPMPGIASEGNLQVPGNPAILGACGSVHANGNLDKVDASVMVAEFVSASGLVIGTPPSLPDGSPAPVYNGAPPVQIPALDPLAHCTGADYRLTSSGQVIHVATGTVYNANGSEVFGWKRSSSNPVIWTLNGDAAVPGTVCAEGNVVMSGDMGSPASPLPMSVVATGSIEVSGNPYVSSTHPDNIQFLAGGDLKISGNPSVGVNNYGGLLYSGSQCMVNGNPSVNGQLICDNKADPPGSVDLIQENKINGNPTITFDCDANVFNKRRVLTWSQRFGN
jgi:hypothetical protein